MVIYVKVFPSLSCSFDLETIKIPSITLRKNCQRLVQPDWGVLSILVYIVNTIVHRRRKSAKKRVDNVQGSTREFIENEVIELTLRIATTLLRAVLFKYALIQAGIFFNICKKTSHSTTQRRPKSNHFIETNFSPSESKQLNGECASPAIRKSLWSRFNYLYRGLMIFTAVCETSGTL